MANQNAMASFMRKQQPQKDETIQQQPQQPRSVGYDNFTQRQQPQSTGWSGVDRSALKTNQSGSSGSDKSASDRAYTYNIEELGMSPLEAAWAVGGFPEVFRQGWKVIGNNLGFTGNQEQAGPTKEQIAQQNQADSDLEYTNQTWGHGAKPGTSYTDTWSGIRYTLNRDGTITIWYPPQGKDGEPWQETILDPRSSAFSELSDREQARQGQLWSEAIEKVTGEANEQIKEENEPIEAGYETGDSLFKTEYPQEKYPEFYDESGNPKRDDPNVPDGPWKKLWSKETKEEVGIRADSVPPTGTNTETEPETPAWQPTLEDEWAWYTDADGNRQRITQQMIWDAEKTFWDKYGAGGGYSSLLDMHTRATPEQLQKFYNSMMSSSNPEDRLLAMYIASAWMDQYSQKYGIEWNDLWNSETGIGLDALKKIVNGERGREGNTLSDLLALAAKGGSEGLAALQYLAGGNDYYGMGWGLADVANLLAGYGYGASGSTDLDPEGLQKLLASDPSRDWQTEMTLNNLMMLINQGALGNRDIDETLYQMMMGMFDKAGYELVDAGEDFEMPDDLRYLDFTNDQDIVATNLPTSFSGWGPGSYIYDWDKNDSAYYDTIPWAIMLADDQAEGRTPGAKQVIRRKSVETGA